MKPLFATACSALLLGLSVRAQDILPLVPAGQDRPPVSAHRVANVPANAPKPEPALTALPKLFDKYQVVGLSDLHGCAELLAFVEQLVQAPEFAAKVTDLTWEPGNVRFQNVMDDFILRGKEVSFKALSQCWRNNTQVHTYSDTPALFHLLQTIRNTNLKLPEPRRLRVLLVDPPVDWSRIQSKGDFHEKDFDRETHMAEVLEREVYAKGRKALFFAGGAHLGRGGSPLQMLERGHPGSTFNIAIHEGFGDRTGELEARLQTWPRPSLAHLRGTWWGELTPPPDGNVFFRRDGKAVEPRSDRKIQDNWDAVLYLGQRKDLTRVDPPGPDVLDGEWMTELRRRKSLRGGPGGGLELKEKPHSRQFFSDEAPQADRMIRLPLPNGGPPKP
jgi:hypothetical protein